MQTSFMGHRYDPLHFEASVLDPIDIAVHLSNECRFGGGVGKMYSVLMHSLAGIALAISGGVTNRDNLYLKFLLHDASEAYLRDIPAPLKQTNEMQFYRRAENRIQNEIFVKYILPVLSNQDRFPHDPFRHCHRLDKTLGFAENKTFRGVDGEPDSDFVDLDLVSPAVSVLKKLVGYSRNYLLSVYLTLFENYTGIQVDWDSYKTRMEACGYKNIPEVSKIKEDSFFGIANNLLRKPSVFVNKKKSRWAEFDPRRTMWTYEFDFSEPAPTTGAIIPRRVYDEISVEHCQAMEMALRPALDTQRQDLNIAMPSDLTMAELMQSLDDGENSEGF